MSAQDRRLVLVSGAPGSGKTTLAVPLAAELGFALLRKDRIKEALHDGLGASAPELAARRYTDRAATGHPVHVITSLTPDLLAEYDQPVGIGDLLTVDTAVGVDIAALADRVRASLRVAV